MTQTTVRPARVGARVLACVGAGIAALSLAYACAETKRSLGDECIKSEDCLSGICSAFVCSATPPLIDAMVENTEAGETTDSGSGGETGVADTGSAQETGSSSGSEAGDGPSEASGD